MILRREAPLALLDSYEIDVPPPPTRTSAASTCSTDIIAPHSRQERRMRQAVLRLAGEVEFAKRSVTGGRLSTPSSIARRCRPTTSMPGSVARGRART